MSAMPWRERAVAFECEGSRLLGILALPKNAGLTGVVVVVGGPQYRSGSHRQFTLLARYLAGQGIATMRFDYRGMGDSEGSMRNFENVNADIRAAIDVLQHNAPEIRHIVLWGLCDAASAALFYANSDARVKGLILLNPWVHSPISAARVQLRYYYLSRLRQPSFWKKLFTGKVALADSTRNLAHASRIAGSGKTSSAPEDSRHGSPGYIERMLDELKNFSGRTLCLLSENDFTAKEFIGLIQGDKGWKRVCRSERFQRQSVEGANHTFSARIWREQVEQYTAKWVNLGNSEF